MPSVAFAENPNRRFASRWSEVRSNSIGGCWLDGFVVSDTVPSRFAHCATMASARVFSQMRSGFVVPC